MNKNVGTRNRRSYRRGYVDIKSLTHLPGYKLSDKNFFEMTGAENFIANQTTLAKNISSQLQNIFKTHIKQSGVEFQYFSEDKFNQSVTKIDNCQFSIFHLNIRSLNCNHKSLQILLGSLNHSYNVICLSECWNKNLPFLTTIFPDYNCKYQEALSSNTGGVAIFYKKGYKVEKKMNEYDINPNKDLTMDVDNLWMHIETDQHVKILLGVIYRHPKGNISLFNEKLTTTLEKIRNDKAIETCFLAGDFNIDISQYYTHYPTENFLDILSSHSFLPTILMPTRITYRSATLIDNIYLFQRKNKSNQKIISGNIYSDITDHLPNFALLTYPEKMPPKPRPLIRVYNKKSISSFTESLKQQNWDKVYQDDDPNRSFEIFYNIFKDLHDKHFPLQQLSRKKSKDKPWMTKELHQMRKTRDENRKKVNEGKLDMKTYKEHKNLTRKKIREAERQYYMNIFDAKKNGILNMWKIIGKTLNPNRDKSQNMINRLLVNGKNITDDHQIAEAMNNFFCTVGKDLAEKLRKPKTSFSDYLKKPQIKRFTFAPFSETLVTEIVERLNKHKSPGPDGISNRILSLSIEQIKKPLTHLVNLSMSKGVFPEKLKLAQVIPLFKKGDSFLCTNYRPISLLSCFHKLFEKFMKMRLENYLDNNNILYQHQYGFRKTYSTNLALLEAVDEIYSKLNDGFYGIGIYLDLQKAFDTVNHDILLKKLDYYGIRGTPLNWFKSYLLDRKQFTKVNGVKSSSQTVECGVPQGSVLGPLLFLIYINDISKAFKNAIPKLFADDTNIFIFHKTKDALFQIANTELDSLENWLLANKLSLSIGIDKETKFSFFTPNKNERKDDLPDLKLLGHNLPLTDYVKYLGVLLDDSLTFKNHIAKLCDKLKQYTGVFYLLRHNLPKHCLRTLYFTFIFNNLYYCAEVYGNTTASYLQPLQIAQNKALRALQFKDRYFPINEMHKEFQILKVNDVIEYKLSKLIHSLLKGTPRLPEVLHKLIIPTDTIHTRNTRHKHQVYSKREKKPIGKRQLKCQPSQTWNNYPEYIRSTETHGQFKTAFYEWKLESYTSSTLNFAPNMF